MKILSLILGMVVVASLLLSISFAEESEPPPDNPFPKEIVVVISALIGAGVGSLGAQILSHKLTAKKEKQEEIDILNSKYFVQFQYAAELLYGRLENLTLDTRERSDVTYLQQSTLYAICCVLAYKRLFYLEGIHFQMQQLKLPIRKELLKVILEFDKSFDALRMTFKTDQNFNQPPPLPTDPLVAADPPMYHYDKELLGEAVLDISETGSRIITYFEFTKRFPRKEFPLGFGSTDDSFEKGLNLIGLILKLYDDIVWHKKISDNIWLCRDSLVEIINVLKDKTEIESRAEHLSKTPKELINFIKKKLGLADNVKNILITPLETSQVMVDGRVPNVPIVPVISPLLSDFEIRVNEFKTTEDLTSEQADKLLRHKDSIMDRLD